MAFDFKKEYREFYMPKDKPSIVTVPPMNYIAVRGEGDPNAEDGAYKQAIGILYGIAFTIKMSRKGDHRIEGYFDLRRRGDITDYSTVCSATNTQPPVALSIFLTKAASRMASPTSSKAMAPETPVRVTPGRAARTAAESVEPAAFRASRAV